ELVGFLQRAQALGVRRRDVDRDVRGVRIHLLEGNRVVVDRALGRRVGVLADVDSNDAVPARAAYVGDEGVGADVVEAEAVDDRFALRNAEQARARIARLRAGRDGADFDEAETERGHRVDVLGILVEARGEADRIRELETHGAYRA